MPQPRGYFAWRIELNAALNIEEVTQQMKKNSKGAMVNFHPKAAKATVVHYSIRDWSGTVEMSPGTVSGRGSRNKSIEIGITDYEYFSDRPGQNGRRMDHRHFFVKGPGPEAAVPVLLIIDIFKAAIPLALWRDDLPAQDVRQQWCKLQPGTIIR